MWRCDWQSVAAQRCCSLLGWLAFRTALWQWGTGGTRGVCGLSEVLLYFNYLEEWLTQPANACTTQVPDAQYPRKNIFGGMQENNSYHLCRAMLGMFADILKAKTQTLQVNISFMNRVSPNCAQSVHSVFLFLLTLTIHVWYIFTYLYHLLPMDVSKNSGTSKWMVYKGKPY